MCGKAIAGYIHVYSYG